MATALDTAPPVTPVTTLSALCDGCHEIVQADMAEAQEALAIAMRADRHGIMDILDCFNEGGIAQVMYEYADYRPVGTDAAHRPTPPTGLSIADVMNAVNRAAMAMRDGASAYTVMNAARDAACDHYEEDKQIDAILSALRNLCGPADAEVLHV